MVPVPGVEGAALPEGGVLRPGIRVGVTGGVVVLAGEVPVAVPGVTGGVVVLAGEVPVAVRGVTGGVVVQAGELPIPGVVPVPGVM